MRYVNLNATSGALTGIISPTDYLHQLPSFADALPPGARSFATDKAHYDFYSGRCVKDLTLELVQFTEPDGDGDEIVARFRHNCWKHEEDLVIHYLGVSAFDVDTPAGPDWTHLDTVILDELLPHAHGCTHEIAFRPGTLTVTCRDLTAVWVEADCPDKAAPGQS
ncbi:hypothetical protein [Kitasatospora viridis]|uniref:Immunity protein 50 of polymorphic toxin system n=1 Tax=Kitasatospora viridis TaxID=281105 RepID=A0A561TTC1_9ACTN|nr:hypothetical protein [Kitasatospora viridis]TWF90362.1 hypothetical protein FHX73_13406 [Kitasatospora viridis]